MAAGSVQWGNVAEWIAAVGSAVALLLTYALLRHEIGVRRDEQRERVHVAAQERQALIRAALDEIKGNLDLAATGHEHYVWYPFELDALIALSRELPASSTASASVARVRTELRRYNAGAAYSNDKVGFGNGAMDDYLQRRSQEVAELLKEAQSALEDVMASLGASQASGATWGSV